MFDLMSRSPFEMPPTISYAINRTGFVVGVDLGQANDFTAITIADRILEMVDDREQPARYEVSHLQRLKLGTSYPRIVEIVVKIIKALPPRSSPPILVVDATGVGRPVVDLMRRSGLHPIAVTITAGFNEGQTGNFARSIPKRNLVSALQVVFQGGRLKIARGLAEGQPLVTELMNFKLKISASGHDSYEA